MSGKVGVKIGGKVCGLKWGYVDLSLEYYTYPQYVPSYPQDYSHIFTRGIYTY